MTRRARYESDDQIWRRFLRQCVASSAELASREDGRVSTLGDLGRDARHAYKAVCPVDARRGLQLIELAEKFVGAAPAFRKAWAPTLGGRALAIMQLIGEPPPPATPPAPEPDAPPPYWLRD